ncbi:MAG: hypothetical protein JXB85_04910 [Anaerolineales bacterium]|nr:hypothetical protein [Anaerolineales bacterium]
MKFIAFASDPAKSGGIRDPGSGGTSIGKVLVARRKTSTALNPPPNKNTRLLLRTAGAAVPPHFALSHYVAFVENHALCPDHHPAGL